jgi:hypothetical protein
MQAVAEELVWLESYNYDGFLRAQNRTTTHEPINRRLSLLSMPILGGVAFYAAWLTLTGA